MPEEKNDLAAFLGMVNSLKDGKGKTLVPDADLADVENGATEIPGEVTDARRRGETVTFVQNRPREQWHWQMPDGSRVPYEGS